MTGRQKFLMSLAYKYCPQYEVKFDKDNGVMTIRVWIDNIHFLSITDVPSLAGTNQFQVRYCEQTKNWCSPSPRVGQLDTLFGKKGRKSGSKFTIADAYQITDVLSNLKIIPKTKSSILREEAVWFSEPRDCFY